jgi:hypothetical protein
VTREAAAPSSIRTRTAHARVGQRGGHVGESLVLGTTHARDAGFEDPVHPEVPRA